MERTPYNIKKSSFSMFVLQLLVLIYSLVILLVIRVNEFLSIFESQLECDNSKTGGEEKTADFEVTWCSDQTRDDGRLCSGEVEMVMGRLGLFFRQDREEEEGMEWSEEELLRLFESKEPSLEEVKEAFDVFDLNRDGLIDAMELQRVLLSLGFKEGLEIENCRRMIKTCDQNGDGAVDFMEFLRFMERSFC